MNNKFLSIIFGMILLIGVVTAGAITNVNPVTLDIPNFIAGGRTSTTFSFDYPDVNGNYNNAPLVAKVNISSLDSEYPVWKGDFIINMIAKQYFLPTIFGEIFPINTIPMKCNETAPINFKAKDKPDIQYTINEVLDGTFYCYNSDYYMLQLDSNDKITLNISSNPALYAGQYSLSVELLEMEPDRVGPIIKLVSPNETSIFSENNQIIPVKLNITDMYNLDSSSVKYKIVSLGIPSEGAGLNTTYYDSGWIYDIPYNPSSNLYEASFNMTPHNLNQSGSYWIYAEAKDVLGNNGKL